jgi:hypothetical protein
MLSYASSRYIGVSKHKKIWQADISKDGVKYNLGRHEIEEDAARAYNSKALELYGEFANLNVSPYDAFIFV